MPKLANFSGEEVCRILDAHEFARVRQKGSHLVMQKKVGAGTLTVPVPLHKNLCIGTLQSIIRQSGLPKTIFMK